MNQSFIARQWAALCNSAALTSARLSQDASPSAARLMQSQSRTFCELTSPQDKSSLEEMYTRRMALSARLTAIVRSDAMIRDCPDAASDVIDEVARFCEGELPTTSDAFLQMQVKNVELTRTVAQLCEASSAEGDPTP